MSKVAIIGAGNLGSAIAYEIAAQGIVSELIIIDILKDLAEGQAADIQQALVSKNTMKVRFGEYSDLIDSEMVIITAGKPRTLEMKDRLQLAEINLKIMDSIITEIKKYARNSIIITVTNPMDVLNNHIFRQGFERTKVVGSGGELDSARFKVALGYPEQDFDAFVLGEHGEHQVPLFSKVYFHQKKKEFSEEEKEIFREKIKKTALTVIEKKGATTFAPAAHTAAMVKAIVNDEHQEMICSVNLAGEYGLSDVSLGVPIILGKKGIIKIQEWQIDEEEREQLRFAAKKLTAFYKEITTSYQQKLFKE
ncbi:malate dehydrogenase [Candidatus Woesearchaeota archaeon]|nr:malate dehydrogenase [Candidatus Woesearchaeota archaeon]